MACTQIASSILRNCDKPLVTGLEETIYLLPFDDVDKTLSTLDATNKQLLTNLVMKAAKTGYKVEGIQFSNDHDTALVKGKYVDAFEHNLMFRIFDISEVTKQWIMQLLNTRVIVVIGNKVSSGNEAAKYEVLGWELGLELMEMTRNQNDADTKGGYVLKIACDDTNKEPKLPLTFFKTDAATTKAAVEALVTA